MIVAPQTPARAYPSFAPFPSSSASDSAPFGSLRPMVSEVDLDELDFKPRFRSSGKRKALFVFGVAAVALAGFAMANPNRAATAWSKAQSLWAAKNASASQAVAPPAPDPVPPTQPQATAATPPAQSTPSDADRLSDEKKRALLDADKARAAQHQAKASAAAPAHRSSSYKSDGKTVFHKGGDKYDPLNSSL